MELQDRLEDLKETYRNLVIEEYRLAKVTSDVEKYDTYDIKAGIKGHAKAEQCENYLKITINKLPERVKKSDHIKGVANAYFQEVKNFWQGIIYYALSELGQPVRYKESVLIIKIYYKNKEWDLDNYNIKFIVDAIRYFGIIKNDSFKELSYMVVGDISEDFRTELYLVEKENFTKVYEKDI